MNADIAITLSILASTAFFYLYWRFKVLEDTVGELIYEKVRKTDL